MTVPHDTTRSAAVAEEAEALSDERQTSRRANLLLF